MEPIAQGLGVWYPEYDALGEPVPAASVVEALMAPAPAAPVAPPAPA